MGSQPPSIHINIDHLRHPYEHAASPSLSEEDEDGVQVSPDEISPDYSVVHPASNSGSSQQGDPFVPLPYPSDLQESEPDAYPYQVAPRAVRRSRQRSETSRDSSIHREPSRRVAQLQQPGYHPRQRVRHVSHPDSAADDTDSTENFLAQPDDQPEYAVRMPRDTRYHGQSAYTHSSSSGSYNYPQVPHHSHQMVHYAPGPPPGAMQPYQNPQINHQQPYPYPPQQHPQMPQPYQPHPHASPPPHPYAQLNTQPPAHVTSPYGQGPYGPPAVQQQYQSPTSYFPPQFPGYAQHPYYMQQMQQMQQQFPGMSLHQMAPFMQPPPMQSPAPPVASPAPAPAEPKFDEVAMMTKFQAMIMADREERERREEERTREARAKEDERLRAIQSAEERAAAMAAAEKERREEEKRIRADALRQAEEDAAKFRKLQAERAEEEKRIRLEAIRAAEEEAAAQRKRDAERRAEEARIREEARKEALEAEKARIALEAERAAYEQKIRKEAAEAALAAAAAEAKSKQEQADREAKIAAEAAEAAKNAADKQAKELQEAADKAAKDAAESAQAAAKAAKEEHEAAVKAAKEEHEAKLKEEQAAAKAAKEEVEAKMKEEQAAREAAEKAAAEAAAKNPPEKKAPLKFKDALGRHYNFPWERCCKWDDMENLIQQAFNHIDKIGPHVLQGHFDLIGPDKEIIMPDYWEDSIYPGVTITMMLWPIPEPEPEPEPAPQPEFEIPPPPPLDMDAFDIDAILNGTAGAGVKKSKSKDKGGTKKKPAAAGGFASWMLGGSGGARGRPALKGNKKPDLAVIY